MRNDFRVIRGGKTDNAEPPAHQHEPADVAQLRHKADNYRCLLSCSPSDEISGLVDDMEEAISALRHLENSRHPAAPCRAAEYRRLIAEIDGEIAAVLKGI